MFDLNAVQLADSTRSSQRTQRRYMATLKYQSIQITGYVII